MTVLFCITTVNFSAETNAAPQFPTKNCRPDHHPEMMFRPAGRFIL
jgi:hypothetical protein